MFPFLPFFLGVAVGAAYCAPVGPVNLEMVRRGLSVGFVAGFLVGLGAVIGEIGRARAFGAFPRPRGCRST